jgi:hypothetical protein
MNKGSERVQELWHCSLPEVHMLCSDTAHLMQVAYFGIRFYKSFLLFKDIGLQYE